MVIRFIGQYKTQNIVYIKQLSNLYRNSTGQIIFFYVYIRRYEIHIIMIVKPYLSSKLKSLEEINFIFNVIIFIISIFCLLQWHNKIEIVNNNCFNYIIGFTKPFIIISQSIVYQPLNDGNPVYWVNDNVKVMGKNWLHRLRVNKISYN